MLDPPLHLYVFERNREVGPFFSKKHTLPPDEIGEKENTTPGERALQLDVYSVAAYQDKTTSIQNVSCS
jgi:hypothetical protein